MNEPRAKPTFSTARSKADFEAATNLVWAFFDYIHARYPDRKEMVNAYIEDQDVAGQLANFAANFNPPAGECVLAWLDEAPVGIVMLKPERPGVCELNRMYVDPVARGYGVGRGLCDTLISVARDLGYAQIRLDAVDKRIEAIPLYKKLGFLPDADPPEFALSDPDIISLRMVL